MQNKRKPSLEITLCWGTFYHIWKHFLENDIMHENKMVHTQRNLTKEYLNYISQKLQIFSIMEI